MRSCTLKTTDSKFWKSLIKQTNVIYDHMKGVVGNGFQIDIFNDACWIYFLGKSPQRYPNHWSHTIPGPTTISHLITSSETQTS